MSSNGLAAVNHGGSLCGSGGRRRGHRVVRAGLVLAAAVLVLLLAAAAGASPPNLITNAGTQISALDSTGDWTFTGAGSQTVNTSLVREGLGSLQLTATAPGDRAAIDKTVTLDMSSMARGGQVRFWVHLAGDWQTTLAEVKLRFATSTSSFEYRLSSLDGMHQGWNLITAGSGDFVAGAGASWSSLIVGVRFEVWPVAGQSASVCLDGLRCGVYASPVVVMSFDDGLMSVYSKAYPIMAARGLKGTAYIVSNDVINDTNMSLDELHALYAAGWDIANHTVTHPDDLSLLTTEQIAGELAGCANYLIENGMPRAAFDVAYPGGVCTSAVLEAMAATGMRTGRLVTYRPLALPLDEPTMLGASATDPSALTPAQIKARIDQAVRNGGVIQLLFHDIVPAVVDPTYELSEATFTSICDYLVAHHIPALTVSELQGLSRPDVYADLTPPVTTTDFDGSVHYLPVTVRFAAADIGSGVATTQYSLDGGAHWKPGNAVTLSAPGVTPVSYRSVDVAGNHEAPKTVPVTIKVDSTPPVTSCSGASASSSSWTDKAVRAELTASDGESGVAMISYRIDGGALQPYTDPLIISAPGRHTITYFSTDRAGNAGMEQFGYVNIDTTAPTATCSLSTRLNRAGWSSTPVAVTFGGEDSLSGVSRTEYKLPGRGWKSGASVVVRRQGTTTISYRAVDAAGNVSRVGSKTVRIDSVAPVAMALNDVKVGRGGRAKLTLRVSDRSASSATVTIRILKQKNSAKPLRTIVLGARPVGKKYVAIWTCSLPKGRYVWSVSATDPAGNTQIRASFGRIVVH